MKLKSLLQPSFRSFFIAIVFGFVLVLSGCDLSTDARQWINQIAQSEIFQKTETLPVDTQTPTVESTETLPPPTPTAEIPAGPLELIVWVPPQFDPQADTPEAQLLRDRLNAFTTNERDVFINVRIKAASGPSGMLEALAVTNSAAQAAMPSLVLLPRSDVQSAVTRKLIFPMEPFTGAIEHPDWYNYARQLTTWGGSSYGLPFAGDALMLLYRPALIGKAPVNWDDILRRGEPLSIPAADLQALITINMYESAGGKLENAQRLPPLDLELLTKIFQIYENGSQLGAYPLWITQLQNDADAWTTYNELRANWVVTWSSRLLQNTQEDTIGVSFPAIGENPVTLADGWVWCLTEPDPNAQSSSVQLAEFLTAPEFLTLWTPQAGYLPVRPSSLQGWNDSSLTLLLGQVALSAQAKPSNEVIATFGPVLQDLLLQVISGKTTATIAAQAVLDKIGNQ
ncbi:MAG: hypothetical protein CVU39_24480 [Chloroflexi bacterium HGW-Chloroflexi-10]|nr:MAG: hypothetical protein CVU39_24480 [Chloroflexi bacterium HGW-Chloroflexi-10]